MPLRSPRSVFAGTEPDQTADFIGDVQVTTFGGDDSSTSVQHPDNELPDETDLAGATSSYPTNAAGFYTDSCEQLIQACDPPPSTLVSLGSRSEDMLAAATSHAGGHIGDDLALAKVPQRGRIDSLSIDRNIGLCICRAGLGQAGKTNRKCKSTTQRPRTSERDELLLHLRNVAQLNWGTIVTYFPETTPSAVKRRYNQLEERKMTCQTVGKQSSLRAHGRRRASFLATSACGIECVSGSCTRASVLRPRFPELHSMVFPALAKRRNNLDKGQSSATFRQRICAGMNRKT
ncbi:hypothetical protein LTR66_007651 [Elasticomyces elasticus]|nr:hypothetical protein LTR50_007393 [Elasticomyces elasticus]KAK4987222.1 hypothetical protein LTR66_007651 [Elasticomyces elasticus]